MPLTPEDALEQAKRNLIADATVTRKLVERGADDKNVFNVLKSLAPVFGYLPRDVYDLLPSDDLLSDAKMAPVIGHLIPNGLSVGGRKSVTYGDLLSTKFREKPWWTHFRRLMELHDEVIWVTRVSKAGLWVVHNLTVSPGRQRPAIIIPARRTGLNHVRVIRLELFVEEHANE